VRKAISLLLLLLTLFAFTQEDPLNSIVKRINELTNFYLTFDLGSLKVPILDAIAASKEKNIVSVYLDLVNKKPLWVVYSQGKKIQIDPMTGKIISTEQFNYIFANQSVSLKDAISLAFVSIGKSIFFAYLQDENTWAVGSKDQLALVSTKTPAVISVQKREIKNR